MTATSAITETAWQHQVEQLAAHLGWKTMHVRRSKVRDDRWATATSVPGWPDLTLWSTRRQRLIVAELKTDTGRATPDQIDTLHDLAACGIPAYIWRPRDLNVVKAILTGLTPPGDALTINQLHPRKSA